MKLILKQTVKAIKSNLGRFLSIFFIVLLGAGFFAGIRSASNDMILTADKYYDDYNLMDFKISSTYGLTKDDVKSLEDLKNIDKVVPTYSIDTFNNKDVLRVHAINEDINNLMLTSGRMPEKDNECVAEDGTYKIGDTITLSGNNVEESLKNTKYKVVGLVNSPLYNSTQRPITTLGSGKLYSYIYINENNFDMSVYTEVYLTAKNSKDLNSYSTNYETTIEKLRSELETIEPILITRRYEEILEDITNEIESLEENLNNEKEKAIEEFTKQKVELDDNQYQIDQAKRTLDRQKYTLESTKTSTEAKINQGKVDLENGWNEYYKNLEIFNSTKDSILEGLNTLQITITNTENEVQNLKKQIDDLKQNNPESELLPSLEAEYNTKLATLEGLKNTLEEKTNEYNNASSTLESTLNTLNQKSQELQEEKTNFKNTISANEKKINDAYQELEANQKKLDDGYEQYNVAYNEFTNKINDGYRQIEEARQKLDEVEKPEWYLLDRTDNIGYTDFKNDAERVDSIASVFPVFFIVVAALVCLNTMTRMIEEERTQIGIYKALGYNNYSIIFNYILYVFVPTFLGSLIGLIIGYNILPRVIFDAYAFSYKMPKLSIYIDPLTFISIMVVAILSVILVTIYSANKELREEPAFLLRPKAPKKGKKIFLERLKFIWKHINFTGKVTIRNLFRYKKRIFMTVIGIAGCTGLMLTGFGLRDSISSIVKLQFEDTFKYNAMLVLNEDVENYTEDITKILSDNKINDKTLIKQELLSFKTGTKKHDVYLMVPKVSDELYKYISFKDYKTNKDVELNDNGAIITEKMAKLLDAQVGDNIKIRDNNNQLYFIKVNNIVKNYTYHYMYMTNSYYEKVFEKDITYNTIVANTDENINQTELSENLIESNKFLNINFTEDNIETFDTIIGALNNIVILILFFACLLAFTVLYNLTTINITERVREIATIKVLGFYDKEVSSYIYRETIVLTIMGIALGLFLGVFLHRFVMAAAEQDMIMFEVNIKTLSYILSIIITIIFSVVVQIFTHFKLKKIDMIESLKSVE